MYHPPQEVAIFHTKLKAVSSSTLTVSEWSMLGYRGLGCSGWGSNDLQSQAAMIASLIEAFNQVQGAFAEKTKNLL